jgi:hypothetical protein
MAKVYFLDLRKKYQDNILKVFDRLVDKADGLRILQKNSPSAIKVHVGEHGNINYVSPRYVQRLAELVQRAGGTFFLTDTTTLYAGRRFRADLHIDLAREHGFDFAPMIIADGLYGDDYVEVNGAKITWVWAVVQRVASWKCIHARSPTSMENVALPALLVWITVSMVQ